MNWIILIIAGLFEVVFAFCLGKVKGATGDAVYVWFGCFLVSLAISMYLLFKVTQVLPIGSAYAVWTGIGAVGITLMSILVFKEPAGFWRIFFLLTLIGSIIGLNRITLKVLEKILQPITWCFRNCVLNTGALPHIFIGQRNKAKLKGPEYHSF